MTNKRQVRERFAIRVPRQSTAFGGESTKWLQFHALPLELTYQPRFQANRTLASVGDFRPSHSLSPE
jgi:hypothetical protein